MSDKTTVVIGCSLDRDYNFLLPLTCLLWRDLVGYRPLALLVGAEADWEARPHCQVAVDALGLHDIPHAFIGRAAGYPDHTTAQNCRQHAAALERIESADPGRRLLGDEEWIMPADADLWPIRPAFYHQHEGTPHKAVLYYANGDHFQGKKTTLERAAMGLGTQTIPTCHAVMRAGDWRRIYGLIPGDVAGSIKQSLDAWLPSRTGREASFSLWMSDQQLMTEALCQQFWFPSQVHMIERRGHPPIDRLCRSVPSYWGTGEFDPLKWTDAHMPKSPDSTENWKDALLIVDALLPHHSAWARAYHEEYARRAA